MDYQSIYFGPGGPLPGIFRFLRIQNINVFLTLRGGTGIPMPLIWFVGFRADWSRYFFKKIYKKQK